MEKMVYKAIIRYLKKHHPDDMDNIIKRAKEILPEDHTCETDPDSYCCIRRRFVRLLVCAG